MTTLELDALGRQGPESVVSWTTTDTMLYALGVGASQDSVSELHLTTENSHDVTLQALPTLALVLAQRSVRPTFGGWDMSRAVHGDQSLLLQRPLPAQGSLRLTSTVVAMEDKRSGALVTIETTARELDSDTVVFTCAAGNFIRGLGGFDPEGHRRRPAEPWIAPLAPADAVGTFVTRPDQALLYRLNVDRNPLHSDPTFAAKAGFGRPILHGLCTYGFTARTLVNLLCGGDPALATGISGRFTGPVTPGDRLSVHLWTDDDGQARFRTLFDDGTPAIDHGRFYHREASPTTGTTTTTRQDDIQP
jgi:acyl dehydratase